MQQRDWEHPEQMLSVDDAFNRIVDAVEPLPAVDQPLLDCLGMVLAEDVVATEDIPPFQNSAMDGYAVRSIDTQAASATDPAVLNVVETVAAGSVGRTVIGEGQATRIMTGAPLPTGADTVVRFEETDERDRDHVHQIGIRRAARPHENVRDAGEDVSCGSVVLPKGRRLRPVDIGLLAALNRSSVAVHRRPRVGILATGDEVVDLGPALGPGQIRNSNSYTIAAATERAGGVPILLGIARDHIDELHDRLASAAELDLLVTSGGVSLGDYDVVKDVLASDGEIDLWQVRMKPGKPLAFGHIGSTPLLGLPGNPAAALVSFEQFGRAAVLKMLGQSDLHLNSTKATLTERIENRGGRRHFVRGILTIEDGQPTVRSTGIHGAAMLSALVQSNCFLIIPENVSVAEPGMTVTVQLFDDDPVIRHSLSPQNLH